MMTRRQMLHSTTAAAALAVASTALFGAESRKRMGIGMHSYGFHWKAAKDGSPSAKFSDALEFLKYAKQLGAGGGQVAIGAKDSAYAAKVRAFVESSETYFEAQTALPRQSSD